MNTDHHFVQGAAHTVCQDYALSGTKDDFAYAIVSDGCSSSPDTDCGARLVAQAFRKSIPTSLAVRECMPFDYSVLTLTRVLLHQMKDLLSIPIECLDATIVAAVACPADNLLHLFQWGDGHIVIKEAARLSVYSARYETNAPYYLSYSLNEARNKGYKEQFGEGHAIGTLCDYSTDGFATLISLTTHTVKPFHYWTLPLEGIEHVSVFSDGLETFSEVIEGASKPTQLYPALEPLVSFKGFQGDFVKRRMIRALKDYKNRGITHYDDLSCASISMV